MSVSVDVGCPCWAASLTPVSGSTRGCTVSPERPQRHRVADLGAGPDLAARSRRPSPRTVARSMAVPGTPRGRISLRFDRFVEPATVPGRGQDSASRPTPPRSPTHNDEAPPCMRWRGLAQFHIARIGRLLGRPAPRNLVTDSEVLPPEPVGRSLRARGANSWSRTSSLVT